MCFTTPGFVVSLWTMTIGLIVVVGCMPYVLTTDRRGGATWIQRHPPRIFWVDVAISGDRIAARLRPPDVFGYSTYHLVLTGSHRTPKGVLAASVEPFDQPTTGGEKDKAVIAPASL